jgi:signal transduction histidine kinase
LGTAFASVFLIVLAVLIALAYWGLGQTLRGELDRGLVDAAAQVDDKGLVMAEIDDREFGGVEGSEIETQLLDRSGTPVVASDDDLGTPLLSPAQVGSVFGEGALFADGHDDDGDAQRVLARRLPGTDDRVQVLAVEMDSVAEGQNLLLDRAAPLAAFAGLLAGLTGWLVARRGLAPVTELAAQARGLNARDLSRRLQLRRSESEIARLGQTLNEMLGRIEDARLRERQFTADASHELRTPLAILRAELELARGQVGDVRLRESLDSALEECDRLTDLVDDLLQVARAEADRLDRSELVDVAEIVDAMLPRFAVLARRRDVTLTRRGDAAVRGDRRALASAVSNLLDNAIRHARPGGRVELEIARSRTGVSVTVTDDGPGVDSAYVDRATERFAQLDTGRSDGGGAGLGLAMVAAIAAAHEGRLQLATPTTGNGFAVTLELPAPTESKEER